MHREKEMSDVACAIIVGGGLAGLCAAHTFLAIDSSTSIVLLEKTGHLGGNSVKATSGINASYTRFQKASGIQDSVDCFEWDTTKSYYGSNDLRPSDIQPPSPPLVRALVHGSASAVEWLADSFGIDMSVVGQMGGAQRPRAHRGKEKFPGMMITYTLLHALEQRAHQEPHRVRILTRTRVVSLLHDASHPGALPIVTGVEYACYTPQGVLERRGKCYGAVILATGGYAADSSPTSFLQKYRPDLVSLPTTNGSFSTGDGLSLALGVGASLVDMECVQVHPTGILDPADPNAKTKFLAAEAMRGAGALVLNGSGQRFMDELGTRDYCVACMKKQPTTTFYLVLNERGAGEVAWHVRHYVSRGLMKKYSCGGELARALSVPSTTLQATLDRYNAAASGSEADPFGKSIFPHTPIGMDEAFYVSMITPVVHYTMGGLEVDERARVLLQRGASSPSRLILGLAACGEVAGGVHGKNRLGGNSLLDCVVFGRIAAHTIWEQIRQQNQQKDISKHASGGDAAPTSSSRSYHRMMRIIAHLDVTVERLPPAAITNEAEQLVAATSAPDGFPRDSVVAGTTQPQSYTREDVRTHNTESDCWVIIANMVLNVTAFLNEHPGGKHSIMKFAGTDATEAFDMLHNREMIQKYIADAIIGTLAV